MAKESVLALDIHASNSDKTKNAIATFNRFTFKTKSRPIAVSVASPDRLGWPENFGQLWESDFAKNAERDLRNLLRKSAASRFEIKILDQPANSARKSAKALIEFMNYSESGVLGLITHLKPTPTFAFGGSFTSYLINKVDQDILAIDARAKPVRDFKKLLFATDLSERDSRKFEKALRLAVQLGAELCLVHVMLAPPENFLENASLAGGVSKLKAFLNDQKSATKRDLEELQHYAKQKGVKCSVFMPSSVLPPARVIKNLADKLQTDLILMSSHSGATQAVFFGSTTRDVLNLARRPVLVLK